MAYDKNRVQALLQQSMTTEVLNELVKLNEGLMYKQITKFGMLNDPEALSLAYEALYIAIKTFDIKKPNAFSTYATVCIYNKLGCYVRKIKSNKISTVSYDAPVSGADESLQYKDILESGHSADTEVLENCMLLVIKKLFNAQYDKIKTPMHRNILWAWKSSGFKKTYVEIAFELGCSQSYVSQVINKFRKILKHKLEEVV